MDINSINLIITQSFGKGFKGNCESESRFGLIKEIDKPYMISRYSLLGLVQTAGMLDLNDGSVISVYKKYKPAAEEYARLYKEKTGREVIIHSVI